MYALKVRGQCPEFATQMAIFMTISKYKSLTNIVSDFFPDY